ncbi:MAG: FG-GAP repeat protein, partial [Spirochaetes bacterium]|nr:FG-GAP repeat protein [Spirochaetota bacterium]
MHSGTDWIQQDKLMASDGAGGEEFGNSVSISGDYAIVGACYDNDQGTSSGSAYIFVRNGTDWTEQDKLLPSDGAAYDFFGYSVCISGDYAIVGAFWEFWDDDPGSGSAYIFVRSGTSWTEHAKLTPSDGVTGDCFGRSVCLSGDYAIVGAVQDDDQGTDS